MNFKSLTAASFLLVLIGIFLFFYYLLLVESNISFSVLVIAVLFMSLGVAFSYQGMVKSPTRNKSLFLLTIMILYFSITIMSSIRYSAFSGISSPDNLGEYFVAKATLSRGSWGDDYGVPLEERPTWYFSCLSITIFPTIISEITGFNLEFLFSFVFPIIFSFIPLLIFLIVKEVFKKTEIVALSTILFSEMYRFTAPSMIRQNVALILLLLTLFVVFKKKTSEKQKLRYNILFFLFVIGVVISHYLVSYILIAIFVAIIFAKKLTSARVYLGKTVDYVNLQSLGFLLVLGISWMMYFNSRFFTVNILTATNSFLAIIGMFERRYLSEISLPGRTSGTLVTSWYAFLTMLTIVGLLLLFFRTRKNNQRLFVWTFCGSVLISLLLVTLVTPVLSTVFGFQRVYSISAPLWVPFLAYVLLKINKKSFGVFIFVFLALNLPLSLALPSYTNMVMYTSEKSVEPQLAITHIYNRESDVALYDWLQNWGESNVLVSTDIRGYHSMYNAYFIGPKIVTWPRFAVNSSYLALNYYALNYGLWWSRAGIDDVSGEIPSLISNSNVIYNNAESILLKN